MDQFPHVNTDVLIIKDGQVLLGMPSEKWLQGKEKLWGIPGDDIKFGETMEEAVKRHIHDLFHCQPSKITFLGIHENFAFGNHYVGVGFLADIEEEIHLKPTTEDWEFWEWFPLESLPEDLFEPVKETLKEYRKFMRM